MAKHLTDLPRNVIDGAISGETEHLAFVLGYFSGYIKSSRLGHSKTSSGMSISMSMKQCAVVLNRN